MQKTKIIATIGPASGEEAILKRMMMAGLDAVRLNMSHSDHRYHKKLIKNIKKTAKSLGASIPIILDLQGPKIRTGVMPGSGLTIKKGAKIILVPENASRPKKTDDIYVPIQFADLYKYTKGRQVIYVDDAAIELRVIKVRGRTIVCQVMNDGVIKSHKGLNLPGTNIKCASLTPKDLQDLEFGIKNEVDYIALSFVSSERDIIDLRRRILKLEKKFRSRKDRKRIPETKIIAKIERLQAVKRFNKILRVADAIMIARGDLGIEMPLEDLPLLQKDIIAKCLRSAKPVIVATQMLDSMIIRPYPTRAEVSDIANAILDGTDAIMLSGETASGKYPVKTIKIMDKIARKVDPAEVKQTKKNFLLKSKFLFEQTIARDCKSLAERKKAKAIVCAAKAELIVRAISSLKPKQPVIALTSSKFLQRQLNLSWSVYPYFFKKERLFSKFIDDLKKLLLEEKIVKKGNLMVVYTDSSLGYSEQINLIKV